jgi:hypothetical protein
LTDNFPTAESLRMALTDKLAAPVASFTHDPTPAPAPQRVHSSTTPRLIVEGASAENNREILIGASVEGPTEGATVVVSGLATGSTLSVGRPWGATGWIVPAAELAGALLRPPQGFSGTMEYALTLRGADNAVLERQAIRLDWAASNEARAPVSPRVREPAPANEPATPRELVAAREPAAARVPTIALEPAPAREQPAVRERAPMSDPMRAREVSSEEIRVLLKRGQQLLETGDLASARLLLRRAAEAGNATAAFALAASYDPIVLKELGVYGSAPDIAKAREWYEKAKEYGSKDAPQRLEQLASQSR